MPFNDLQIAAMVLIDGGSSREDAMSALLADPTAVERLAPQIAAKRASFEQQSAAAERAAFEASPAGRAEAARSAQASKLERAQQAEAARTLLEMEGGFPIKHLSDEEVLWAAGIEKKPAHLLNHDERDAALEDLASRWNHMPDGLRRAEAKELGVAPDLIARYVERGPLGVVGGAS